MDGIVYATAAGLGFATIENILYVLDGGIAVGIIRAIASVPGHVVFACIWGFALGTAKFRPENERTGIILTGLFPGPCSCTGSSTSASKCSEFSGCSLSSLSSSRSAGG